LRLVGLADPTGDLPAAEPEVEGLGKHFNPRRRAYASGSQATFAFLTHEVLGATHVHLACHAKGSFFDSTETGVVLSDRTVTAVELTALGELQTRLVVVSACQSALADIVDLPDEALSIGTAMLASGSACAIASLWPVDDYATALLMVRMYEEMFDNQARPPEALRRAQLWLRDLSEEEEDRFLGAYPALEAEFRRRSDEDAAPGRRGASTIFAVEGRPYFHPDYWAPFVAVGV
jgi:CHAT domain-containing protein